MAEKCFVIVGTDKYGNIKVIDHTFWAKDAINSRDFFRNDARYRNYTINIHTATMSDGPEYGYGPVFDID